MSRLDDYLDDRLDADQRARFEEQLAGDEELARQLAAALAIRDELRSGAEELPEAFYTRTVAHFSAARRRRLPFGLNWETAGLAVATIAVAAIFVPFALREDLPDMPAGPEPRQEGLEQAEPAPKKGGRGAGDATSSLESIGYVADEQAPAEQSKDDLVGRDIIGGLDDRKRQAANEPAPEPDQERSVSTKLKTAETPPPSVAVADAIAQQPERKVLAEPLPELEEEPSLGKGRASEGTPTDGLALNMRMEETQRVDVGELDKTVDADAPAESGYFRLRAVPAAVELKTDLAGAGEVELLEAGDARLQFAAGNKKESRAVADSEAAAAAIAVNRFVAIGRRPGLDACTALEVRRTDRTWEISYEDSGSSVGAVSCGIEFPDDGVKIRFQGWPVGE